MIQDKQALFEANMYICLIVLSIFSIQWMETLTKNCLQKFIFGIIWFNVQVYFRRYTLH